LQHSGSKNQERNDSNRAYPVRKSRNRRLWGLSRIKKKQKRGRQKKEPQIMRIMGIGGGEEIKREREEGCGG